MAWAVTHTGASPTGSSGVCGRPLRVLAAAHCMPRCRLAFVCVQICSQRVLHGAEKKLHNSAKRHVAHRPSPTPRPRHCPAHARCAAPCTRAHACRARSTRTHHACAPRQRRTCSHIATRAHVKKKQSWLPCSSHWPLADRRPARHWRIQNTNAVQSHSPSSTDASRFHQYTRCTCHPPPTSAVSRVAENQS